MSKRIVFSVTNEVSYDQRMLKTAMSLLRNGFQVEIVGRIIDKTKQSKEDFCGISISRLRLWNSKGKLFYLEYNLRLLYYLMFKNVDIYCAVDLDTILPNLIVSKFRRKSLVYDAHEFFTEVPELQGRQLEKKIWKLIEKIAIPYCTKIYTVSNGIANLFKSEYDKDFEVIANFPKQYKRDLKIVKENVILYQGDLNEGRGIELAIQAMDFLEGYVLWIAGGGYFENELRTLASKISYPERVLFLGRLLPEELRKHTLKAKYGLNLLENKGLNYFYSLANKYFDYIQAGTIPITMNFPEYAIIESKYQCSILLDSLKLEPYVSIIQSCILNENKYRDLLKNVDIAASFLTWESQEEKLCSIYNNV